MERDYLVTIFREGKEIYHISLHTGSGAAQMIREWHRSTPKGTAFLGKIQTKSSGLVVITEDGINFEGHPRANF